MNVTTTNREISITNPRPDVLAWAQTNLLYTDKSKQYQLRRMEKNPWQRTSNYYKELKASSEGVVYAYDGVTLTLSQGFYDLFCATFPQVPIAEKRCETGHKISLPWINKPHNLRDYQDEAVNLLLEPTRFRSIVNFATGLGKTLMAIHLIKRFKRNTLVVCPSDSIAKQFYEQLESCFGTNMVGMYGGGKKKIADITVGIAASVTRNVAEFQSTDFGLVIFDEIHHVAADTFYSIAEGLAGVGRIVGLTATDYRSDGKDIMITGGCGPVIIRRDIRWGVEHKWLAEPYFIVREVDTHGEDYRDNKLKCYKAHVLNNKTMKDQILSDAKKMMLAGKRVLILVDEIEHGKELSAQLGIPLAIGEDAASQTYVDQLNRGAVPGLVGTDGRIGEGTDTKNVDVLILANFVASKGSVIQAVGRGLRKTDTKDKCLILDYIPCGSKMLSRHAYGRIEYYREVADRVKVITL